MLRDGTLEIKDTQEKKPELNKAGELTQTMAQSF